MSKSSISAADSRNVSPKSKVDQDQNTGDTSTAAAPTVKQKVEARSSFFDIFRSEKTIKRNQRHAELMARIETFSKLEIELVKLNAALDEIIKQLEVGTDNSSKTFLVNAVDKAAVTLTSFNSEAATLLNISSTKKFTKNQVESLYEVYKSAMMNHANFVSVLKNTFNLSNDVKTAVKSITPIYTNHSENLTDLQKRDQRFRFERRYNRETRVADGARNADGTESDSESVDESE